MLIQFNIKNFKSFKDEISFDMTAIKAYKEHAYNLIKVPEGDQEYIKVAAIYGANASGKSSFVEAYSAFDQMIISSFNNDNSDKKKQEKDLLEKLYRPFAFDDENNDIKFEGTYLYGEHEYRYGFCFNSSIITYEWLYKRSLKTNRTSMIIERDGENEQIKLGSTVRRTYSKYLKEIEKDVLVLTFFNRLKSSNSVFKDTFDAITDVLSLPLGFNDSDVEAYVAFLAENTTKGIGIEDLVKFLKAIDVSIENIEVKIVDDDKENIKINTIHIGANGKAYKMPIDEESDGTKKMVVLFFLVMSAIMFDRVLIIDELNVKLHPLLLKYIIDLVNSSNSRAQLIYTTHDTTLLDKRYFRRDQVWFIDKNDNGHSNLYSLAEFKARNDASFEKEYLGGAYGAVPILSSFDLGGE